MTRLYKPETVVAFGPYANADVVWDRALRILEDGMRAAGLRTIMVTSTARTPAEQARVMFENCINPAQSLSMNLENQLALYSSAGNAVIKLFSALTQEMDLEQVVDNRAGIVAAMEREILAQGPCNVSMHCADPAILNVLDVGTRVLDTRRGSLFIESVRTRVKRVVDETFTNDCYHLEIQ